MRLKPWKKLGRNINGDKTSANSDQNNVAFKTNGEKTFKYKANFKSIFIYLLRDRKRRERIFGLWMIMELKGYKVYTHLKCFSLNFCAFSYKLPITLSKLSIVASAFSNIWVGSSSSNIIKQFLPWSKVPLIFSSRIISDNFIKTLSTGKSI